MSSSFDIQQRLRDMATDLVNGSEFAPPADELAIISDCVLITGWSNADGGYGESHIRCGSEWGTHGLVARAAPEIDVLHEQEILERGGDS